MVANLRAAAQIPSKGQIVKDVLAAAALRYLGPGLMTIVLRVQVFFAATYGTGVFNGLGFTVEDYNTAIAREADAQDTDTTIATLSKDAHAESIAAKADLAGKTLKIIQTYAGNLTLPGVDPTIKETLKAAGAKVDAVLLPLKDNRAKNREANAALKNIQASLAASEASNQQLQTENAVRAAQDALKLQSLTGEPLGPKDLVVTELPGAPAQPAPAASAGRSGRRGSAKKATETPANPSPSPKGPTRKAPR
jgi:hypothetical protein